MEDIGAHIGRSGPGESQYVGDLVEATTNSGDSSWWVVCDEGHRSIWALTLSVLSIDFDLVVGRIGQITSSQIDLSIVDVIRSPRASANLSVLVVVLRDGRAASLSTISDRDSNVLVVN